jgi:hypothetical protein
LNFRQPHQALPVCRLYPSFQKPIQVMGSVAPLAACELDQSGKPKVVSHNDTSLPTAGREITVTQGREVTDSGLRNFGGDRPSAGCDQRKSRSEAEGYYPSCPPMPSGGQAPKLCGGDDMYNIAFVNAPCIWPFDAQTRQNPLHRQAPMRN